jgi:dTDP-4-amino-4,6-dideoxygalactose transaminase
MTSGKKRIWLSPPHMGGQEEVFVKEAFATNWVAPLGPNVDAFELQLQQATQTAAAAALNSGTAALHLALKIIGTQPGDIVLCQSMTFAASAFPIVYEKAIPVFIDSEASTWNMDPLLLEQALETAQKNQQKVAAIIVVHLYGMPARMNELLQIAERYQVPIIEDAAEALGALYHGQPCGGLGSIGILSFNGNKIITTSGGGALVSNDPHLVQRARFLSTQAKDPFPHYEHSEIGYNYRMSNISAGIGRGQMLVLGERVAARRRIFDTYREQLGHLPGISFLEEPSGCYSNRWLTTVVIDPQQSGGITREQIRLLLEQQNIEARPLWKPMHLQPVFKNELSYGTGVSEQLFAHGLCLPSGSALTDDEHQLICNLIKQCWNEP